MNAPEYSQSLMMEKYIVSALEELISSTEQKYQQ